MGEIAFLIFVNVCQQIGQTILNLCILTLCIMYVNLVLNMWVQFKMLIILLEKGRNVMKSNICSSFFCNVSFKKMLFLRIRMIVIPDTGLYVFIPAS
jgi:hypothetical protein